MDRERENDALVMRCSCPRASIIEQELNGKRQKNGEYMLNGIKLAYFSWLPTLIPNDKLNTEQA